MWIAPSIGSQRRRERRKEKGEGERERRKEKGKKERTSDKRKGKEKGEKDREQDFSLGKHNCGLSIGYRCLPFAKEKGNKEGKEKGEQGKGKGETGKGKEKGKGERRKGKGERRKGKGKGKGGRGKGEWSGLPYFGEFFRVNGELCYLQLAVCFLSPKVSCAIYSAQFVCVWVSVCVDLV